MNKLLIHNNNTSFSNVEIFPLNEQFVFDVDFDKDVDIYINDNLTEGILKQKIENCDVVFIKVSLSGNYLEYLGLRLAYHIRLTKAILEKTKIPIIIIAEESFQFLGLTYPEPSIFFTNGIYLMKESLRDYLKYLKWIDEGVIRPLNDFGHFVNTLSVSPPASYDSSHSVANEWALMRYSSMFEFDGNDDNYVRLQSKLRDLDYPRSLHYKVLESKANRQRFKNLKNTIKPEIEGISNKRIGIIDDELNKGWLDYYNYVLNKSHAHPNFFTEFEGDATKTQLIDQIEHWVITKIQSSNPIDVFIIDLRLHDDDFIEADFENLTGIQIIKFIKDNNPGVQIVVSTASNKVWNYQKCIKFGAKYFSVKESPYTFNSRIATVESYKNFKSQLAQAVKDSFLAEVFRSLDIIKKNNSFPASISDENREFSEKTFAKNGYLDQIFGLLAIGHENESIIHQCLLIVFQIIERYCQLSMVGDFGRDKHNLSSGFVWLKDNTMLQIFVTSKDIYSSRLDLVYNRFSFQNVKAPTTIASYNLHDDFVSKITTISGLDSTFLAKMISVFSFREGLDKSDIERLISLRYYRSNVAAHSTGNVSSSYRITAEDIDFCIQILKRILQ
jgi:DNA-binding NarL/FixJ family response regulator